LGPVGDRPQPGLLNKHFRTLQTEEAKMPVTLIIMDGWGLNPRADYNAIAQAKTPFFDYIWNNWPSAA
jgi:hypothetical protein